MDKALRSTTATLALPRPCVTRWPAASTGDLERSQRNMGLPAYGTRHPSTTTLATEQNVRSEQQQNPLYYRLETKSRGPMA